MWFCVLTFNFKIFFTNAYLVLLVYLYHLNFALNISMHTFLVISM